MQSDLVKNSSTKMEAARYQVAMAVGHRNISTNVRDTML